MKLAGKVALVTGAAEGIGRGCALALAREGADVLVNDRTRSEAALCTVAEIEALGRQAWLVEGDVFERSSCEAIVARALEHAGRIDALVSNPAYSRRGRFLEFDPEVFERVVAGTLTGGFHMSQLVARGMAERGEGGKIVFISSVQGRIPFAEACAYSAAKAGLTHMARAIAIELLPHRINVNTIEPGWIDTPGERRTFGDEAIAEGARTLPWGRLGTPDDIGQAAAFLCSDAADYMTGSEILVDGGLCLQGSGPLAQPPK